MTFINPLASANAAAQQVANLGGKERPLSRTGDRRRVTGQLTERLDSPVENPDAIVDVSADPDAEDSNRKAPDHRKGKKNKEPRVVPPAVDFTA